MLVDLSGCRIKMQSNNFSHPNFPSWYPHCPRWNTNSPCQALIPTQNGTLRVLKHRAALPLQSVQSGHYNKILQTGWFTNNKKEIDSHGSGGREVQDQGTSRSNVWRGLTSWLTDSFPPPPCPHVAKG